VLVPLRALTLVPALMLVPRLALVPRLVLALVPASALRRPSGAGY
jgi:hypothetical protein